MTSPVSFKEETLDQEVFETIKNFVSSEGCHRELMSHLDDTVDVTALEVEKTQLQGQLKQVVGAKDNLLERIDILDIEDKHYNRKVEDMNTRLSNLYDKIGNIEDIDMIITDSGINPNVVKQIKEHGIEVIVAH